MKFLPGNIRTSLVKVGTGLAIFLLPLTQVSAAIGSHEPSHPAAKELYKAGEEISGGQHYSLPTIIASVVKQLLGLVGLVLVCLVLYGGYLWMTAGGNADQITKAKKIIINSVIGIVIIFAAYAIADFVLQAVLKGTGVT